MGRPNTLVLREMKTTPPHSSSSNLLADRVYETLRGHIAQGHWAPGTQLRIREVAALVGTSVMPVREALGRLEQAGLIVTEPYRGASVRELSIDELEYVYDATPSGTDCPGGAISPTSSLRSKPATATAHSAFSNMCAGLLGPPCGEFWIHGQPEPSSTSSDHHRTRSAPSTSVRGADRISGCGCA